MRRRLAGFARTLRDNGFRVGLAETSDALAVLASPAALRADVAQAGACARCSARRIPTGSASTRFSTPIGAAKACGSGKSCPAHRARAKRRRAGLPRRTCRKKRSAFPIVSNGAATATARTRPTAAAAAKAPRAPRVLSATDLRHIADPGRYRGDACARGAACPHHARAARSPRAGPPPRPAARSAPHHSPQRLARRHADRPRLAPPQDQAAAARRAARRLRLDEPLHRVLRPLPAWRRRQLPRSRGLRLSHPPGARLAVAARPRRDARGR